VDVEDIGKTLKLIFVIVGLSEKNYPEQTEFDFLKNKAKEYFKNLTLEEIVLAFEFAVQKKYNVDLCLYNKPFSLSYLSDVISEYKKYKFDMIKNQPKMEEKKPSEKEVNSMLKHGIIQQFRLYKTNYLKDFNDFGNVRYNYLAKIGLINYTEEKKQTIREKAKEAWNLKLQSDLIKSKYSSEREHFRDVLKNFDIIVKNKTGINAISGIAKTLFKFISSFYFSVITIKF